MYYISSKINGGKYGITDTQDGVEEFYTKQKVQKFIEKGIKIIGVRATCDCEIYDIIIYPDKPLVYYEFEDFVDGVFLIKELYRFDNDVKFDIELNTVHRLTYEDLIKWDFSKRKIYDLDKWKKSQIKDNDNFVYGIMNNKHFLLNSSVCWKDDISNREKVNIYNLKSYNFMLFDSLEDVLIYCKQHKLVIDNDFYSQNSRYYWAFSIMGSSICVDRVLFLHNRYLPLCKFITIYCAGLLTSIYDRLVDKEILFTESGTGSFNPKSNCFHFTQDGKTLSFELGTTEPESKLLIDGNYDWQSDLQKYGICITRASVHTAKSYVSDITFYEK